MGTAGPSATRGWKPAATVVLVLVGLAVPTWVQLMPSWGSIDEEVAPDAGDSVLLMTLPAQKLETTAVNTLVIDRGSDAS